MIPGLARLHGIASKTDVQAVVATQSLAPQELSTPVDTATYPTPTLSFGEVGETKDQQTTGYASFASGVGEFDQTRLLERMIHIATIDWSTSSSGTIYNGDVDKVLRQNARNASVLSQFNYYRSDIELTVRLNTNQFYYGALMCTMFPTNATGNRVDERAVLDPTVISASLADSVVKTWHYSFPWAWKPLHGSRADDGPVRMVLDVLAPLTCANQSMPDTVSVQVWARFKNISLSYPVGQAQSSNEEVDASTILKLPKPKYPTVKVREGAVRHPVDDEGKKSTFKTMQAIENITIGDIVGDAMKVIPSLLPFGDFFFDKPDFSGFQTPIIQEPSTDLFLSDVTDTNVNVSLYRDHYLDPGPGRIPMSKEYTISQYAQIPGLRSRVITFDTVDDSQVIQLIQSHPTGSSYAIPLDYAYLASCLWRGSLKVCLQFFTSSFISARFVVQYANVAEFGSQYPNDYTNGISKVINVKGDTTDTFILPWLSRDWWSDDTTPEIKVTLASRIACTDAVSDPIIYMLAWVAGGPDIQFAYPTPVKRLDWYAEQALTDESGSDFEVIRAESAIGEIFLESFSPIVENVRFDVDHGFCHNETIRSISSVAKRYSPLDPSIYDSVHFPGRALDNDSSKTLMEWFRSTHFGTWRYAFLFRSGGYRFRYYSPEDQKLMFRIGTESGKLIGTHYKTPTDGVVRLTVPQLGIYPFEQLNSKVSGYQNYLSITPFPVIPTTDSENPCYLAARDDLQLGYPILPSRFTA